LVVDSFFGGELLMSLKSFVALAEVANRIKPLRPKLPRKIGGPLRVPPRTKNYDTVGTALDYLIRFEIQRRAPHAKVYDWVAEKVPDMFFFNKTSTKGFRASGSWVDEESLRKLDPGRPHDPLTIAKSAAEKARSVVDQAKVAVAQYSRDQCPTSVGVVDIARHAIRLALLDVVYRSGRVDRRSSMTRTSTTSKTSRNFWPSRRLTC
jgi:hypothetical protein